MSQRTVQFLIGTIITDEDLRRRFVRQPEATLAALCDQGIELTKLEIDALLRTDKYVWEAAAKRIDPLLLRCSLDPQPCD